MPSRPLYFDVPAEYKARPCRSCGRAITFVRTAKGKLMPVDIPEEPGGKGRAHFQTCNDPDRFSKGRG